MDFGYPSIANLAPDFAGSNVTVMSDILWWIARLTSSAWIALEFLPRESMRPLQYDCRLSTIRFVGYPQS